MRLGEKLDLVDQDQLLGRDDRQVKRAVVEIEGNDQVGGTELLREQREEPRVGLDAVRFDIDEGYVQFVRVGGRDRKFAGDPRLDQRPLEPIAALGQDLARGGQPALLVENPRRSRMSSDEATRSDSLALAMTVTKRGASSRDV